MIFNRLRADVNWSPIDDRWYQADPVKGGTFAGFPINPRTANRVSAVFACNSLIAETLAATPCKLYRRLDDKGGKEEAKDHRLYRTVRYQPNRMFTAMDFFGFGQGHLGMRGNSVSEIRDDGKTVELIPHHPSNVTIELLPSGRGRYQVRDPKTGRSRTLLQDEVLHVRDLSEDGLVGMARAVLAREAIAVAAAGEAFVGGFFKNDATGRLVISHPGPSVPDQKQRDEFKNDLRRQFGGWRNTRNPMVLYAGMKAEEMGRHDDSGFIIDPRKFQVADVARFWRVPGFMIGLEEKSTSWGTGIEQQKQGWVDFTMRAWFTRWEQSLARDLLTEDEQEELVFEFELRDLLRGDFLTRTQALSLQKDHGVLSPNEWRAIEKMNARPGGDKYQETPQGAAPARGSASPAKTPPPAEEDEPDDTQARAVPASLLIDAASRIAAAELREVAPRKGKAKEDSARFVAWAHDFFERQVDYASRVLRPMADAFGRHHGLSQLVSVEISDSALRALTEPGAEGVPEGWCDQRRDEIAAILTTHFSAAGVAA